MKFRVERERTDTGLGAGWVVMTPEGAVLMVQPSWSRALLFAYALARGRGMFS